MPRVDPGSAQRSANRGRVVNALRASGALSRAALLKTGLSRSTVASVVDQLLDDGVVVELEPPRAARGAGRPPQLIGLRGEVAAAAGIEIANGIMRLAICDLAQTLVLAEETQLDPRTPAADALALARGLIDGLVERAGYRHDQLIGVGIALPGPIQRRTGLIGRACTLKPWVGVRAAELAAGMLERPVLVDNDANLAALAEVTWGAGRGYDDVAYVYTAAGIGAGLLLNGRLYAGANGTAGEIGHTTIDEDGQICGCGGRGCLNTVADADAIVRQLWPTLGEAITIGDVIKRAQDGDGGCRRVLADAGRHIGAAMANLYNLLDPQLIVIGGNLGRAGPAFLEPLRESMVRRAIHAGEAIPPVVPGELDDRVAVLGAAAGVLRDAMNFPLPHTGPELNHTRRSGRRSTGPPERRTASGPLA